MRLFLVLIKKAFYTLSTVCGFVILFSLVISMIQVSGILNFINNIWIQNFILGLIEITSGINLISGIASTNLLVKLLFTSFLFGYWRYFCFASGLECNF